MKTEPGPSTASTASTASTPPSHTPPCTRMPDRLSGSRKPRPFSITWPRRKTRTSQLPFGAAKSTAWMLRPSNKERDRNELDSGRQHPQIFQVHPLRRPPRRRSEIPPGLVQEELSWWLLLGLLASRAPAPALLRHSARSRRYHQRQARAVRDEEAGKSSGFRRRCLWGTAYRGQRHERPRKRRSHGNNVPSRRSQRPVH